MKNAKISNAVIKRLPRYRRYLIELKKKGVEKISSKEFSNLIGYTASQIRQDLNNFGGFGQQGYGYNVESLKTEIEKILGLDKEYNAVLAGVGNLGHAFAQHIDFKGAGFNLTAAFDLNPALIGQKVGNVEIFDFHEIESYCRNNRVDVAVLCVPKEVANQVTETFISCGVTSFWNFTYADISIGHPDIIVENVHLGDGLMTLCYKITDSKK